MYNVKYIIFNKKAVESAKRCVEQNIFSVKLNNKFKVLQIAIDTEELWIQELFSASAELQKLAEATSKVAYKNIQQSKVFV